MSTVIEQSGIAIVGHHATFGIARTDVVGAYKFHWMKNGALIGGAPSAKSYTTPPLSVSDLKAKYSVKVFGQDSAEISNELNPAPEWIAKKTEPEPTEKEVSNAVGNLES